MSAQVDGAGPAPCAHQGCTDDAAFRRWCGQHRNVRLLYLQARAEGLSRKAAAQRLGIHVNSTYPWERGRPSSRPRTPWPGMDDRIEEYRDLTRDLGLKPTEAAVRLGVCERTARRYEARIRAEAS